MWNAGQVTNFVDFVRQQLSRFDPADALRREGISVSKEQFVLDLPPDDDLLGELFDCVAVVCGLDRSRLTLSERHVNVYAADAAPEPRPHKDRYASQVSIGFPIAVPEGSHFVFWPDEDRTPNPLQRAGLTEALPQDQAPEVVLAGSPAVKIHDQPGDVHMFPGSDLWHTRRFPAGAVVLYFKCNDFGSDPLGEDPGTPGARARSLELLARRDAFISSTALLARRFESVTREFAVRARQHWFNVNIWGRLPLRISPTEFEILCMVGDAPLVDDVLRGSGALLEGPLRRLVELGALDLVAGAPRVG